MTEIPSPPSAVPDAGPRPLEPGTTFGKYEIVRVIGVGGMGSVYEALHTMLRKRVALKTLHVDKTTDGDALTRFVREGETLARIRHPNVVDISDVGVEDGLSFLVMELLEGENLRQMLKRTGALDERATLQVIVPIVAGLAAAHQLGIVHRDIKPENVVLARDAKGEVTPKLVDFGISKDLEGVLGAGITMSHALVGTPSYMSPEQARADVTIDARADQYAIGVLAYECLTGRVPFEGRGLIELMNRISQGKYEALRAVRPDLSPQLEAVIHRAMATDPADRYESTEALGRALLPFASTRTRVAYERQFGMQASDSVAPPAMHAQATIEVVMVPPPQGLRAHDDTVPDVMPDTIAVRPSRAVPPPATSLAPSPRVSDPWTGVPTPTSTTPVVRPPPPPPPAARSTASQMPSARFWLAALVGIPIVFGISAFATKLMIDASVEKSIAQLEAREPVRARRASYALTLDVVPDTARIFLDGAPVATGRYEGALRKDGREHVLTIRAEGYAERELHFRDEPPTETQVTLERLPTGGEPSPGVAGPTP